MVAAEVVLIIADVDADEDREGVMEEAVEVVSGVADIAEECLTSTALISLTPRAHLLTNNRLRSVQAVRDLISLSNS